MDIRNTLVRIRRYFSLQSCYDLSHFLDNLWIFAIALVTPAPSRVPANLHVQHEMCKVIAMIIFIDDHELSCWLPRCKEQKCKESLWLLALMQ